MNSRDKPDTAESQNSESLHCGVCTTGVDYLIWCERCDIWHCHTCAKVSEQLIGLLVDCSEAHWFCHTCNPIAVEAICNLSEINSSGAVSLEAHKNAVESITTAIKHLDEVVLDTKKQLCKFAKTFQVVSENEGTITDMANMSSDVSGTNMTTNSPPPSVDNLTNSLIAKQKEWDKRKLSIILHGIGESTVEDSQFRKHYDITSLNSNFSKYLNITPTITNAIRLDKKDSDKPCLMKITLNSLEEKSLILQNKFKLKNEKNPDSCN